MTGRICTGVFVGARSGLGGPLGWIQLQQYRSRAAGAPIAVCIVFATTCESLFNKRAFRPRQLLEITFSSVATSNVLKEAIVSITTLGSAFGGFVGGFASDFYGRQEAHNNLHHLFVMKIFNQFTKCYIPSFLPSFIN